MKTAQGTSYASLLDFEVRNTTMLVGIELSENSIGNITPAMIAAAISFITERIRSQRTPAATFEKELGKIELHRKHLADAYLKLFESYLHATMPQKGVSNVETAAMTAQHEMLEAMPDKMLRSFSEMYLGDLAQEYLLPDDRGAMITAVVAAMKEVKL